MTNSPRGELHTQTLALIKNAPRNITFTMMAEHCGVSVAWISRFAANKINHPSVNVVECLNKYLVEVSK